jgi:hypothetical protein
MSPDAYRHILVASLAGGVTGVVVMWNRKRSEVAGASRLRQLAVLTIGTAASACALVAFTKAFAEHAHIQAALVMILITGWAAVVHSVVQHPLPRRLLTVCAGEFAVLRTPWTGVRAFGWILRHTPLRHLGGQVYLAEAGRDPQVVLRGMFAAETVHVLALVFCSPWLVWWGLHGQWLPLLCGLAVHLPLNVYPILHLRYVTWRLDRYVASKRRRRDAYSSSPSS